MSLFIVLWRSLHPICQVDKPGSEIAEINEKTATALSVF